MVAAERDKGPLVQVPIRPGLTVQLPEAEARELGYLPAKEREKSPNKGRRRPATKGDG